MFLVPITGYISNMFSRTPAVLPLPTADGSGAEGGTNVTSFSSSMQPSEVINANSAAAQHNVLLNENPSRLNVYQQLLLYYYDPNLAENGGIGNSVGEDVGAGAEAKEGSA
jgi:hypothetical protein